MTVTKNMFGLMPDGKEVFEYQLENDNGMKVSVLTLGGTLRSIFLVDKNGLEKDVLLGFDTVDDYLNLSSYQGALVGPFANRIGNGRFEIDGQLFEVVKNEKDVTCLHSGGEFSFAVWNSLIIDSDAVEFSYESPDGENGFPGNISVRVVYRLGQNNDLHISYYAKSDKKTPINLTNHAYFNLNGYDSGDILSHNLQLNCSAITPVDELSIPTGDLLDVSNTPFDFRVAKPIGKEIDAEHEQLVFTGGYDHNFVIDGCDGTLRECAVAACEESGIRLTVSTTLPGVQFYAGNFLEGEIGKAGKPMTKRSGFCLETQYYPDSPNNAQFPNCIFEPGEEYESETVFEFSIAE